MARSRLRRIVLRTLAILAGAVVLCLALIAFGLFPGLILGIVGDAAKAIAG